MEIAEARHSFLSKTFRAPTNCEICGKLFWGISRQGYCCTYCNINVHRRCIGEADQSLKCHFSQLPRRNSSVDLGVAPSESGSSVMFDMEDIESAVVVGEKNAEESVEASQSMPSLVKKPSTLSLFQRSPLPSGPTSPTQTAAPKLPKPGVFQNLMETAAAKAVDLKKHPVTQPKLSLFSTLPKNFRNFVMKNGPMAHAQARVEDILFWKTPSETLLVIAVYTLICLNPRILLFVPHLILLGLLSYNYFLKTQNSSKRTRQHKSSKSEPAKITSAPDQINYRHNMQFIQNVMGMYCDIYDAACIFQTKIDWSNEARTKMILQATIVSFIGLFFMNSIIPWNYACLLGGWGVFAANTAIGKALGTVALQFIEENCDDLDLKKLLANIKVQTKSLVSRNRKETVTSCVTLELMENQRWWAGLGWVSQLLKSERAAWTNADGTLETVPVSKAEDVVALVSLLTNEDEEKEWKWAQDSAWKVDKTWSSAIDDEGWVYTDHSWNEVDRKSGGSVLTRRRKYTRQAVCL